MMSVSHPGLARARKRRDRYGRKRMSVKNREEGNIKGPDSNGVNQLTVSILVQETQWRHY